jgi:hypothetical protein
MQFNQIEAISQKKGDPPQPDLFDILPLTRTIQPCSLADVNIAARENAESV